MLAALLLSAQAIGGEPWFEFEVGHFRHVQWLEERRGRQRFATVALRVEAPPRVDRADAPDFGAQRYVGSWVEIRTTDGALESRLAVPALLLRSYSYTTPPTWRILEHGGRTLLVHVDHDTHQLHVTDFETDEPVLAAHPARCLLDARSLDEAADVLIRTATGLEWIHIDDTCTRIQASDVETELDDVAAARFPRTNGWARVHPHECWAIGWRTGTMLLSRSLADGSGYRAVRPTLTEPLTRVGQLRLDVLVQGDSTWIAIGDPDWDRGVGRVAVLEASECRTRMVYVGRTIDRVDGAQSIDHRLFGQTVRFVEDVDLDGAPELLVAGPDSGPLSQVPFVDLLSPGAGASIARHHHDHFTRYGNWLDVDDRRGLVLVGGASDWGSVENYVGAGRVRILDTSDLSVKADHSLHRIRRRR